MPFIGACGDVLPLEGAREANEDQRVQEDQIEQEEVSRTGAARQQPGEVQAPPSEPPPARQHPACHLGTETGRSQVIVQVMDGWTDGRCTFWAISGWLGSRLAAPHSSSVSMSMLTSLWASLDKLKPETF